MASSLLAVTSLMRTIELQFLAPQPLVSLTNKEKIESVHGKLRDLLVFLDEYEKRVNNQSAEMKDLAEKIKKVTLKAEDDIEEELLKVHHHHKVDTTLKRVAKDIDDLIQSTKSTKNRLAASNDPRTSVGGPTQRASNVEDAMVGHSKEWDKVMFELLSASRDQRRVMAMVGMGGIGKTTFAKRVYEDPIVKSHFDLRAWAVLSQEHDKDLVLTDLIRCVDTNMDGGPAEQLRKKLMGKRYLIILDDIWTSKAWDDIHLCFPDNNDGSRVLLTTRYKTVADYAIDSWGENPGEYSHDLHFLNPDESWHLFSQKLLDRNCLNNSEFEKIGRNIVQKCQGLPLTIVVLAGLLSTMNKSLDEWKNVETTINSLVTCNLNEQFSRILTLSYNNLPPYLKCCFLYLGVFHEDCEIPVKKLIRLWIAEGFVDTISSRSPEEVGWDYLQDLINRSLVIVHRQSFGGQIKTCRMHDLLHELCVNKSKEENLLYLEATSSEDYIVERFAWLPGKRWLSLKVLVPALHLKVDMEGCRSILCFNMVVNCDREWYLYTNTFKKLRVLDLSKIKLKREILPPNITELVFLRYLALSSSEPLIHIPLRKNWNLQTLIINEDDNGTRKMPCGISVFPQLRHLQVYHQVSIDLPEEVQENLHTIYWLSTLQCTREALEKIPNVKELGILAPERQASLHGLNNLSYLNHLEKLRIQGSFHPLHLPSCDANVFPRNLKKLTFVKTLVPWEDMTILSTLPQLEVLKLRNFACIGEVWELTEEGGFPQLKVLIISVTNLKEWNANVDNPFPVLECLQLRNFFELKEMPNIFEDVATLKKIKLDYCYDSLVKSAEMIKAMQLELGNDMLDVLHSNIRPDEDHVHNCEDESVPHGLTSLWFEARKMSIAGGDEPDCWAWIQICDSGNVHTNGYEVAVLKRMSWFQIGVTFDIRCLCKVTLFSAYLVFKLARASPFRNVKTALARVRYVKESSIHGWTRGENRNSQVFLAKKQCYEDRGRFPDNRSDGWMEIKIGDFYVSTGNEGDVELLLWHTSDQYYMSGLVVKGIEVRPN